MKHQRVPLHRPEVADAAARVHLRHEAVPQLRHQPRPPLVLPLLERGGARNLEAVQERAPDLHVAAVQPPHVRIHHAVGERHRGLLHEHVLAAHFRLQH